MTYIIDAYVGQRRVEREIDEALFNKIKNAQRILKSQHHIEERFEIFLANYIDLEKKIFELLVLHTLRHQKIYEASDQTPSEIGRCLSNLLCSATGYRAQVMRYKTLNGRKTATKPLFDKLEASSSEYSALEALRDHDQHVSLLVRSWGLPSEWVDQKDGKNKRRHGLAAYIEVSDLLKEDNREKKLSSSKLSTLPSKDGQISLMPIIRKYIEDVGLLHNEIRKLQADDLASIRSTYAEARQVAIDFGAKPGEIIFAYHLNEHETVEKVYLGLKLLESLLFLQTKNRVPLLRHGDIQFLT